MADYKDYYATLGVSKSSSDDEIKSAYRKLAKKYHPDKNKSDKAAPDKFKDINEAYEVLSDPEKKQLYDTYGSSGGIPQGAYGGGAAADMGGMSDFFQQFFGGAGGMGGRGGGNFGPSGINLEELFGNAQGGVRRPAQQVTGEISIPLRDAFVGTVRAVQINGKRLEVSIPAGTRSGQKLRLAGQAPGGGDVILTLTLERDSIFTLEGDDVRVSVELPIPVAVLGGKQRVPTLGGNVDLTIPPGSSSGKTLRLKGQGWPGKTGRGDQLVRLEIGVPKSLSPEELELYQKLEALRGIKA